ncbi:hypothetical protein AAB992_32245 [Burkholderia contaminans]|uniref:hypothetical protein n=1 Tax=Burkholderia contaminans TaxID=488447 RepID=UPI002416EC40|nr:hypothetical protein [Burkholderia contaminans]WFN12015.1 hypothetical protein LXE92_27230 [Burkholderia contaminans]
MHAHASVFTLHRHAQSRIGHALEQQEVTSLQRFLRTLRRVCLTATTTRTR